MENKKWYEEQLKEAEQEKIVYMQALKNYYHCFENENQEEMIVFISQKLSKIISNIAYYEEKIKEFEDLENEM